MRSYDIGYKRQHTPTVHCLHRLCGTLTALRAHCLLRRLVASQLLASRALVASQLVRFEDTAVPASWDMLYSLEIWRG